MSQVLTIVATVLAVCGVVRAQQPAHRSLRSAGDRYENQVRDYMRNYETRLRSAGYSITHGPLLGSLDEDDTESLILDLPARIGGYRIVGVCDADCTDLDLALFDNRDRRVDEDIASDDTPVVAVSPIRSSSTRYRLRVTMTDCSAEPCRYAVAVFGKSYIARTEQSHGGPALHLLQ